MKVLCAFGRYAYGDPARGEGYELVNFLPAIEKIASQTRLFDSFNRRGYRDFADLNEQFLRTIADFKPDVIFAVLMGYEVWTETLDIVRANSPAAILHWGTDDSWKYERFSRFLAPHVDLHVTTSAGAANAAAKMGMRNVVLSQWAASDRFLAPPVKSEDCDFDVTFVGAAYGNRRQWIEGLQQRGVKVRCFGHGWDGGVVDAQGLREIYRRSRISLNFAGSSGQLSGLSVSHARQIKARVFEVPGAGGFLLSEAMDGIDAYFRVGEEIAVFEDVEGLATVIDHYLAHPRQRDAVAEAGFARVAGEHTYEKRFAGLIETARAAARPRRDRSWAIDPATQVAPFAARHRTGPAWRMAKACMTRAAGLAFGHERGARAARRATHEVYVRLYGARTYSCAGLPGRLFYRES